MTNSPFAAHPFGGPFPLQSVHWSHRKTTSSDSIWEGKAGWHRASSKSLVCSTLCSLGPRGQDSLCHLCHLPAELGPRPAFQQTGANSNSGKLGYGTRL